MPLDALCLRGVVHELRREIVGLRIEKIQQPARDEVILTLRGSRRLLLNAGSNQPRLHLTTIPRENPAAPPMFCMLLRKHLAGGQIIALEQAGLDRVVTLTVRSADELGVTGEKRLVLECMGRSANLILLDGEGRIIDCLRRVDMEMSQRRQVLPGLFYRLPPAQEKLDPLTISREEFAALLERTGDHWGEENLYSGARGYDLTVTMAGGTVERAEGLRLEILGEASGSVTLLLSCSAIPSEDFRPACELLKKLL